MLCPLTFRPVYKDYIWGGRSLASLGKTLPDGRVAESWEISAHPNGESVVNGGAFDGRTLSSLAAEYGSRLLGEKNGAFPLLIKLIDAHDRLSVQVHPDDAYARREIGPSERGKNECWFVVRAEEGASIVAGTAEGMTRERFAEAVKNGTVNDTLRRVPVHAGDFVFIPAGLVHAIGAGLIILEIQQSSDTTYRVYDYDRVGADGKKRPLHVERALDVIDFSLRADVIASGGRTVLTDNGFFRVENVTVNGRTVLDTGKRHFDALTLYDGSAVLEWADGELTLPPASGVLVPAELGAYSLNGKARLLRAF